MGFELILCIAVILTGGLFALKPALPVPYQDNRLLKELASLFPILLLVFLIRSFLFEPFRIPSGSMKPVFIEGDFVVLDKFSHGLRWPITSHRITKSLPKRGDVVVFRGEVRGKDSYVIKRIIGVPGDHITYRNKELFLNGQKVSSAYLGTEYDEDLESGYRFVAHRYHEILGNKEYDIYRFPAIEKRSYPYDDIVVPEGHYFVMGNNRDNSNDSRYWGLLSDDQVVGHARMIWFSMHPKKWKIRWDRIGNIV